MLDQLGVGAKKHRNDLIDHSGVSSGRRGIRTPDVREDMPVFKTGAISRSAILPNCDSVVFCSNHGEQSSIGNSFWVIQKAPDLLTSRLLGKIISTTNLS